MVFEERSVAHRPAADAPGAGAESRPAMIADIFEILSGLMGVCFLVIGIADGLKRRRDARANRTRCVRCIAAASWQPLQSGVEQPAEHARRR